MDTEIQIDTNHALARAFNESHPEDDLMQVDQVENNAADLPIARNSEEVEPTKYRRLMITKIELENFKSYYGKKVIGPLHKNFTAVVGPNGSGKSNCIESLLFVFGKRAKQMRLNKLSELIHKSAAFPNCTEATVRVHFTEIIDEWRDPDAYTEVPDTQFTVSRLVTRASTSKYYLNRQMVDYKDVCQLLMDKGIDLDHNRFLILQGEVEQISLMKPKSVGPNDTGLLEYLEEIIGSSAHVETIEELARILEQANERRIEATNRVKASGNELASLDSERQIALTFINQERRLWKIQNFRFFIELSDAVQQFNDAGKQITEQREHLRKQKEKKKETFEQHSSLVAEINSLHSKQDQADRKHKELLKDFEVLERADVVVNNEKTNKVNEIKKCERKITEQQTEKIQMTERYTAITNEMPSLEKKSVQLTKTREEAEKKFENEDMKVRESTEALRKEMAEIEQPLGKIQHQLRTIKQQIESRKADREQIIQRSQKLDGDIELSRNQMNSCQQKLSHASQELQGFQEKLEDLKRTLVAGQEQEKKLTYDIKLKADERRVLQGKLSSMKSSVEEAQQGTHALTKLKEAQRQGLISGLFGRLGDLGTIPEQFDIAISTACGQLDCYVVDTVTHGEECIKFLRENRAGKGNFICLDRVRTQHSHNMEKQFNAPANSQRLFDLIKPNDPQFAVAFYLAIKNTLVCKDLNTANQVALNSGNGMRHRVVTLDGSLIETAGTISGGGRPRKGGMSSTRIEEFSPQQIREAQNQLDTMDKLIKVQHEQLGQVESENQMQTRKVDDAKRSMEKASVEVQSYGQFKHQSQSKLDEFLHEQKEFQKQLDLCDQLQEEINKDSKRSADLYPQVDELKAKQEEKKSQILDVGGANYKKLKQSMDDSQRLEQECLRELTRNKSTLANSDQSLLKIDQEIQKQQRAIKELTEIREKLQAEIDKNDAAGQKLIADCQACEAVKKECEQVLEGKKKDFNEMKKTLEAINQEEVKYKDKLEDMVREREIYKKKCDQIKHNVKVNRDRFKRSVEEFGDENNGNEPSSGQPNESARESQSRQSMMSEQQSQRSLPRAQGFEWYIKNKDIYWTLSDEEINLLKVQKSEIGREEALLKEQVESANPNVQILTTYRARKKEHDGKLEILKEIEQQLTEKRIEFEELRERRHKQFRTGFELIAMHVKKIYRLITNGGDADLETIDALDPFSEGILFQVRPKNKSWKHMSKLSGGEKTLSSLALIFALHVFKPSPLYCMDEIDAALDYKNVAIVGKYIREGVCKQGRVDAAGSGLGSQFIIISLRNNMFELADKMVGIYKRNDMTQTITVNPKQMQEKIERMLPQGAQRPVTAKDRENQDGEQDADEASD